MSTVIGNKQTTQLVELTSAELLPTDLFYVVDLSARESKKMQAGELALWLSESGSIVSLHAQTADTASFILGSQVAGAVASSSWAQFSLNALSASFVLLTISASFSQTASFALNSGASNPTASFLLYSGVPNGTASFALTASLTYNTLTASFLQYIGAFNGTASYAITSQNVPHATTADTASFFSNTIGTVATASFASVAAVALNTTQADTASYLQFSPTNGTASFALKAGSVGGSNNNFGVFLANTQSVSFSQLDDVNTNTTLAVPTSVEAVGTIVIPYTSSIPVDETLTLIALDRIMGTQTILDQTPIYFSLSPTIGNWDSFDSGSVKMPFSLLGQANLLGEYQIFITASSKIQIESSRTSRFDITSTSDGLTVSSNEPLFFTVSPSSSILMFSSSVGPDIYFDNVYGINSSGSTNVVQVFASGSSLSSVRYIWALNNLTLLDCSNNLITPSLGGMPNSLSTLICHDNLLFSMSPISNTSMSFFDCSNNSMHSLPTLPDTMSSGYLNCSNNPLDSLPDPLPFGLTDLFADQTPISLLPAQIPDTVVSMSFMTSSGLILFNTVLPTALVSFDCGGSPITTLPTIPPNVLYLSALNCDLFPITMENVTGELVSNGLLSGSLDLRGNGAPDAITFTNITTLISRDWTVLHD